MHLDAGKKAASWAVCGGANFVERAVLMLRSAGMHVHALSVLPESMHNLSARLKAQDKQDSLCGTLNVPLGLSVEAFSRNASESDFRWVLLEKPAALAETATEALVRQGVTLLRAREGAF